MRKATAARVCRTERPDFRSFAGAMQRLSLPTSARPTHVATAAYARVATAALALALLLAAPAPALGWDPAGATIAPGVSIGGVPVGELNASQATAAVRTAYGEPRIAIRLAGHWRHATAAQLGQTLPIAAAITRAMSVGRDGTPVATTGVDIPLRVVVRRTKLEAWISLLARSIDRRPRNASYRLVRNRPRITGDRDGYVVDQAYVRAVIAVRLARPGTPADRTIHYSHRFMRAVHARIRRRHLPRVIVIDRSSNRLYLYSPRRLVRSWRVATGQPSLPTPLGSYTIVTKQVNPTWTPPPDAEWAKGLEPIPPGPNNPLGTRWMGLSANGIGIHGTNKPSSIGRYASHGCIRMRVPEVERLFRLVKIGTPVHIVR